MCLAIITRQYDQPLRLKKPRRVWKVFHKVWISSTEIDRRHVSSSYICYRLPVGKWVADQTTEWLVASGSRNTYRTGFHAFATRKAAQDYADRGNYEFVRRCRLDQLTAIGKQYGETVLVGRRLLIERERKKGGK